MSRLFRCYDTRSCVFRENGKCKILDDPPHQDGVCGFAKRLMTGKTYRRKQELEEKDKRPFFFKWPYNGRFR